MMRDGEKEERVEWSGVEWSGEGEHHMLNICGAGRRAVRQYEYIWHRDLGSSRIIDQLHFINQPRRPIKYINTLYIRNSFFWKVRVRESLQREGREVEGKHGEGGEKIGEE